MLFNSIEFLIFAPLALMGHALLRGKPMKIWLVVASYIFYGWAEPWYVLLLLLSTVLDFNIGLAMHAAKSEARRKFLLILSLAGNLGILGIFKYTGFLTRSLNEALGAAGTGVQLPVWEPPLPVGISFYTFQTLSYTIDIYRGKLTPTRNFTTFALYVAFFPQLVAGPIERATHLLQQLEAKMSRTAEDVAIGLTRILWGLTKKIVFADWLALYVDAVYGSHEGASGFELLMATYAFAFQIYLDFSAYSDIAIGLARLMGIDIRENFRWPYLARNISEFWRRWHISLSTWLRDYLYFPLGGSRKGPSRTIVNVFIVMFLGGLWHGAKWTFVVWGLWIGLGLAVYHVWSTLRKSKADETRPLRPADLPGVLLTFHVILISWVFFRADSLPVAWDVLRSIVTDFGFMQTRVTDLQQSIALAITLTIAVAAHLLRGVGATGPLHRVRSPIALGLFWAVLIAIMMVFYAPAGARFIYFQF